MMAMTTKVATTHYAFAKNGCAASSRRASSSGYGDLRRGTTRREKKRGESVGRFDAVSDGGLDAAAAAEAAAQRERDVAAKWAGSSVVREARQKGRARSGRGASSSTSTPTGDEVFGGESSGAGSTGTRAIESDDDDEDYMDGASIGESCLLADGIWEKLREEAKADLEREPSLASYLYSTILAHKSIEDVLAFVLANKLRNNVLLDSQLLELFSSQYKKHPDLSRMCLADMQAVFERDPACDRYLAIVLFFKGFQAIQAQRVAHSLWLEDRKALSFLLQNRISEVFHVDIHPGAVLGQGMMMDHATGVVIGETAVVGENVSILHGVTLGGTGTSKGDRHPKIGDGVVIGANVTILGNIKVGADTKIGAGSVVLDEIPPGSTAVGIPAKVINRAGAAPQQPSLSMDQTSYIEDYFI
jgi:serine O-acetyltransferase